MATVNSLLKKSDGGRFLYHAFIGKQFNVDDPQKCRCLNPFYGDTKPDLTFFEGKGGRLRFHDHGDSSFSGDVFDFAKHFFGLFEDSEFTQLLKECDQLLKAYFEGDGEQFKAYKPAKLDSKVVQRKKKEFTIDEIPYTNDALSFWEQSGVSEELLQQYNVCQISGFTEIDEYGETEHVDIRNNEICFAYQFPGFAKLYYPKRKSYKYRFLGNKSEEYYFGSELLDYNADEMQLIIGAGERDVLALIAHGFDAIALSSETAKLPKRLMKDIYEAGYNVHCLYDNDKTGRRESKRLADEGINTLNLFDCLNRGQRRIVNDVTDFVINGHDLKTQLSKLINGEEVDNQKDRDQIPQIFEILQPVSEELVSNSCFDSRIYSQLPPLIADVVKGYEDAHIRDAVLFSSLITIGSITTNVRGEYFNKMVPTNLYGYILGGASGGKSQISVSKKLVEPIHERLYDQSKAELEQYKSLSTEDQKKTKRPAFRQFIVSANISSSALARSLDANDGMALMFEEEADTVANVMSQDWGDISVALRKGAEGEPYSLGRVSLEIPIYLKHIHISLVFSSTYNQLYRMIPSAENGLLSRILFYEIPMNPIFKDPFGDHSTDSKEINKVASELIGFWERESQKKFTSIFRFTPEQQQYFTEKFSNAHQEEIKNAGEGSMMIIRRLGALTFRIAMILSMIRQMNEKQLGRIISCDDRDFETAMLMARYFRKKGIEVLQSYPKVNTHIISRNQKHQNYYDSLPEEFTTKEFKAVAEELGIAQGTAKERIGIWVKTSKLKRVEHGLYKKVKA